MISLIHLFFVAVDCMKVNKAIPIQSAPVVDKYYETFCFTWTGVYCPRTVVNVSHVGGQISWSQEGGRLPRRQGLSVASIQITCHACMPKGREHMRGAWQKEGQWSVFLFCLYSSVSTAHMF